MGRRAWWDGCSELCPELGAATPGRLYLWEQLADRSMGGGALWVPHPTFTPPHPTPTPRTPPAEKNGGQKSMDETGFDRGGAP